MMTKRREQSAHGTGARIIVVHKPHIEERALRWLLMAYDQYWPMGSRVHDPQETRDSIDR